MLLATNTMLVRSGSVWMANQQRIIRGIKGYGGKITSNVSPQVSAVQEIWEETGGVKEKRLRFDEEGGVQVLASALEPVVLVDYYNDQPGRITPFGTPTFRVLNYYCDSFFGHPIDTIEMQNHKRYSIRALPVSAMILGDSLVIPYVLKRVRLRGWIRRDCSIDAQGNYIFHKITGSHFYPCSRGDLEF